MPAFRYLILLCSALPLFAAPVVDGRLDEDHWQHAIVFDQFTTTQPLTLAKPRFRTRVLMVPTEEGLYFGFENEHPNEIARIRPKKARDQNLEADRVSVMIDFQNNGSSAYEFTVSLANAIQDGIIIDQKKFTYDWDGFWQHAVSESETHWYVEMIVPWSTVPAAKGKGDAREIAVYFSRVVHGQGVRYAFPDASWDRPTFVADFHRVTVPNYQSTLLDIFPYATALHDALAGNEKYNGGLDLFWKPNGNHQFTLTANPDFGAVESDDLVVNFSAVEAFFSEKRPFFTENQALFDLDTSSGGKLIHTRRIGATHDNPEAGTADILAALKYRGQVNHWDFGVFGAVEDDADLAEGRDFSVLRARYNQRGLRLGAVAGYTRRPTLDRDALMTAVDLEMQPKANTQLRGQVINTRISQAGTVQEGQGAWLRADWSPGDRTAWRADFSHYDDQYDINDMGFMRRNNLQEAAVRLIRRQFETRAPVQSREWQTAVVVGRNTEGDRLPVFCEWVHKTTYNSTASFEWVIEHDTTGMDDLVTRGNNLVRYPSQTRLWLNYASPAVGVLRYNITFYTEPEFLEDYAWEIEPALSVFVNDALNFTLEPKYRKGREWLLWQSGNDLASYAHDTWQTALNLNWFPADAQELRLRVQWIGISAQGRDRYTAETNGALTPQPGAVDDFVVGNLGLQIRYRYLLGPLTEISAVYSRGGDLFEAEQTQGFSRLFAATWREKIADQFFLKVRYRM